MAGGTRDTDTDTDTPLTLSLAGKHCALVGCPHPRRDPPSRSDKKWGTQCVTPLIERWDLLIGPEHGWDPLARIDKKWGTQCVPP